MNKAVAAGTPSAFELLLEKLAADETTEQVLETHPWLNRQTIFAALFFAGWRKSPIF